MEAYAPNWYPRRFARGQRAGGDPDDYMQAVSVSIDSRVRRFAKDRVVFGQQELEAFIVQTCPQQNACFDHPLQLHGENVRAHGGCQRQ